MTQAVAATPRNGNGNGVIRINSIVQVIVWLLPIIFVAGGLYVMIEQAAEASVKALEGLNDVRMESERKNSENDQKRAVLETRVNEAERIQQELLTEQKRQGENISAICQATNARCR